MLKPQADYCIREVIGWVEYLAVCSKYIVGEIFVWWLWVRYGGRPMLAARMVYVWSGDIYVIRQAVK